MDFYKQGQLAAFEKIGLLGGIANKVLPWLGKNYLKLMTNPTAEKVMMNPLARHLAGGAALGGASHLVSGSPENSMLGSMGRGALLGGGLHAGKAGWQAVKNQPQFLQGMIRGALP